MATQSIASTPASRGWSSPEGQLVGEALRDYAQRGVFLGYSEAQPRQGKENFNVIWHYRRPYRFTLDLAANLVSFPELLPAIASRSPMAKELKDFLAFMSEEHVPPHRRVDPSKGRLQAGVRRGQFFLGMIVENAEYEYCTRKLVNIAHEIFMVFLKDGPYYEYRIDELGLDPDAAWP